MIFLSFQKQVWDKPWISNLTKGFQDLLHLIGFRLCVFLTRGIFKS